MRREMRRLNQCWLILAILYGSTICFAATEKTQADAASALTSSTISNSGTPKDEIYIDDESLEGSGGRGEIRDDLEKEPDYSGSGLGPDDEDSTSHRHQLNLNTNRNKDRQRGSSLDSEDGSGDGDDDIEMDLDEKHEEKKPKPLYPNTSDDEDIDIDDPRTNRKDKVNRPHEDPEIDLTDIDHSHSTDRPDSHSESNNEVFIMNTKPEDRTASFFAQPGILAAVIGGAVVGLLCAILVVMFIVYRMRKKDEGSYALDEPKRSPAVNSYAKNSNNREFYA
ncbi:syndecan isoform X1 [Phlebotomus argentipes]|uniref:syndecan isoform X1 n=1 Tax=Phlebotomus argentipes TaxID=94469 RepID=UPI0028934FC6|nr:syndecan isoform X1 [Phlebotomus argentipes]